MPTLKWIGKDKIINYHNEVPFRLLKENRNLSVNSDDTENLLIKGDNLEALKALLPYYYNQVKVIYIDPPYNTGNENWVFNDNVNSPEIKKWLGKVVGGEAEDLSRHVFLFCGPAQIHLRPVDPRQTNESLLNLLLRLALKSLFPELA